MKPFEPKIYLIEDNIKFVKIITSSLHDTLAAEVCAFATADEALTMLPTNLPDLIILDLELPGISGEEFLQRIRSHPEYSGVFILIMTGHGSVQLQVDLLSNGANDFIEKGVSTEIFLARVRSLLRHKWMRDRLIETVSDADNFAVNVLAKIDSHLSEIETSVKDVEAKLSQNKKPELTQSLSALRKSGENLSHYSMSILQIKTD